MRFIRRRGLYMSHAALMVPVPDGGGGGPASRTYVGKATLAGSGTTARTFSAQAIGTAASDRKVAVIAEMSNSGTGSANPTLTIGGVSATREIMEYNENGDGQSNCLAIFSLDVVSGATADIILSPSISLSEVTIFVYALYGVGAAAATKVGGGNFGTSADLSINTTDGGILIAGSNVASSGDETWTGATQDDEYAGSSVWYTQHRSVASYVATSTETPRTVSTSRGADWNCSASAAVFFPSTA